MAFKSKELQSGVVVFSVGLRKEWSKVASYWVSLVVVPTGPVNFWFSVRSWSFKKDGALIEEDICGTRHARAEQAFRSMKEMIQDKIHNSGYLLHEIKLESTVNQLSDPMLTEIKSYCEVLQQVTTAVQSASKLSPVPVMDWVEQKAQEAKAKEEEHNAFKAAVKRRRQGAKW